MGSILFGGEPVGDGDSSFVKCGRSPRSYPRGITVYVTVYLYILGQFFKNPIIYSIINNLSGHNQSLSISETEDFMSNELHYELICFDIT